MSMASIETMGTVKGGPPSRNFINTNLLSLKCLLFFFFGGMGCLLPYLPLHMVAIGLTLEEIRLVSMVAPCIAILGPIIAGPLADKIAQGGKDPKKGPSSNGRYLRSMIAIGCFLSALTYALLLLVPSVERIELPRMRRHRDLRFSCDERGARIVQESRSRDFPVCYNWTSDSRVCSILLNNCEYACAPLRRDEWRPEGRKNDFSETGNEDFFNDGVEETGSGDEHSTTTPGGVLPIEFDPENGPTWRKMRRNVDGRRGRRYVEGSSEPPHLCFEEGDRRVCHAYTNFSGNIAMNASFREPIDARLRGYRCVYPIDEDVRCRIPADLANKMANLDRRCTVECDLLDPFAVPGAIQRENQCSQVAGDPDMTFWMYSTIRSIADIFPTATIGLLNAAIVTATRETSLGRGDVGRQLAFGSLGFAVFPPLVGYFNNFLPNYFPDFFLPIAVHAGAMLVAAVVALAANDMPLGPPESSWHTTSGMLAVPMSAVKRYGCEIAALFFVLVVLGTFWSVIDTYLPLHLANLHAHTLAIGVILTVGAVPAVIFLWRSEHFVDYCGHSNLLIIAFTIYIIRFTGLSLVTEAWWALAFEALELFTLGIMWVTAILYMRHLVPRHWTATAQALPVIAHFCIGRCLGAVIGAYTHRLVEYDEDDQVETWKFIYRCMALSAAAVAILYFVLYHGLLKPRCHAQTIQGSRNAPTVVQGMNGNGNYTPLRVYHNGMGKKGQFRY